MTVTIILTIFCFGHLVLNLLAKKYEIAILSSFVLGALFISLIHQILIYPLIK